MAEDERNLRLRVVLALEQSTPAATSIAELCERVKAERGAVEAYLRVLVAEGLVWVSGESVVAVDRIPAVVGRPSEAEPRSAHPGPKLDVLRAIQKLVIAHLDGTTRLDAEQTLERIAEVLAPVKRPLTVADVEQTLALMRGQVDVFNHEVAHSTQMALYHRVLGELAERGSELARLALGAREIVTRYE